MHTDPKKESFFRALLVRVLQCAIGLISLAVGCGEPVQAQLYNGKELVKASLVSDVTAIQPGQKFRVGVLYQIEPGWHIYWRFSGDSGIPTKIEWQLPKGFTASNLQCASPASVMHGSVFDFNVRRLRVRRSPCTCHSLAPEFWF